MWDQCAHKSLHLEKGADGVSVTERLEHVLATSGEARVVKATDAPQSPETREVPPEPGWQRGEPSNLLDSKCALSGDLLQWQQDAKTGASAQQNAMVIKSDIQAQYLMWGIFMA